MISIKKCSLTEIHAGMKLGKAIMTEMGTILLAENTMLTDALIAKLPCWGISEVFISQQEVFDVLKDKRRQFVVERDKFIVTVAEIFNLLKDSEQLPVAQLHDFVNEMLMPLLLNSDAVFSYLHVMKYKGEYLFRHSINVAFFAGIMGKWLNLPKTELQQLLMAGLLHDIGKMRIPIAILNKPDKLLPAEMEIMKQHTFWGYEILQNADNIDEIVKLGVLQHHERLDGNGYPASLKVEDISQIARIIAVADVYDAMISQRVYHKAISPIQVMKKIYQKVFGFMDSQICMLFIQYAKKYLVGSLVKLSNGLIAKIIYIYNDGFLEPIVQMMTGECISLEEKSEIKMVEFIC